MNFLLKVKHLFSMKKILMILKLSRTLVSRTNQLFNSFLQSQLRIRLFLHLKCLSCPSNGKKLQKTLRKRSSRRKKFQQIRLFFCSKRNNWMIRNKLQTTQSKISQLSCLYIQFKNLLYWIRLYIHLKKLLFQNLLKIRSKT